MIFVTIGTQLPFDRLIKAIDKWAETHTDIEVYAQLGNGEYIPKHIQYDRYIPPDQFDHFFMNADLIISHAGMGSILTAMSLNKPIIIFPRDASLGEHRNNHQLATAAMLKDKGGVPIAFHVDELYEYLDNWQAVDEIKVTEHESKQNLVSAISNFINDC